MPLQTFHGKLLEAFGFFMGRNVHNTATLLQKAQHVVQHAAARAGACDDVRFLYSQRFPGKGLRKAARQHGHRAGVPPLGAAQPLAAFFVAARRHGAAVHDIHIRFPAVRRGLEAVFIKKLGQRARFVLVHLAAQRIKCNFQNFTSDQAAPETQGDFPAFWSGGHEAIIQKPRRNHKSSADIHACGACMFHIDD